MDLIYLTLLIVAYLLGSISSAVLVCRIFTLPDPRIVGSKNPGATNVLRVGGKRAALATLLGDIIKTLTPLLAAAELNYPNADLIWIGVASLVGHCFPIYFSFKGGKGVATLLTVVIISLPKLSLLMIGSWLICFWSFQRASVASLISCVILIIFCHQFFPQLLLPIYSLCAVVFIRHRSNIANIIQGTEPIIGKNKNQH
jgi:acyl phosphate:glycerol-3-phosphate acyltransferase